MVLSKPRWYGIVFAIGQISFTTTQQFGMLTTSHSCTCTFKINNKMFLHNSLSYDFFVHGQFIVHLMINRKTSYRKLHKLYYVTRLPLVTGCWTGSSYCFSFCFFFFAHMVTKKPIRATVLQLRFWHNRRNFTFQHLNKINWILIQFNKFYFTISSSVWVMDGKKAILFRKGSQMGPNSAYLEGL